MSPFVAESPMMLDPTGLAQSAIIIVVAIGALARIGIWVHAAYSRTERESTKPSAPNEERFVRLEQAVDAIALEVERIAEGQRFTTRLLTERHPDGIQKASDAVVPRGDQSI